MGMLQTAHNLSIEDFDMWTDGGRPGMPKLNVPDDPHSYDHVMVILRNSSLTHGQGSTDAGSAGLLFGYPSDTQSRFGAMNSLPFAILKHEFNHLLLGGNNFHSGGGNAPTFTGYFIPVQGGWSLMGAANSSLLTASAWDRDRLGWRPEGSRFHIRASDRNDAEVNGDLDPLAGDTGIYVIRDFITSGDAIRIRMPFLEADEYPQWLWLENHQTKSNNGCQMDVFHYEEMDCVKPAVPGIYAQMQVDKEKKTGSGIYGGHADYLRPVLANGNFDQRLRGDTITFKCLWPGPTEPYVVKRAWANPLSGTQDQEFPLFDKNGDGKLTRKEANAPRVGIHDGKMVDDAAYLGSSRQVFTPQGNRRIGMGQPLQCEHAKLGDQHEHGAEPGEEAGQPPRVSERHQRGAAGTAQRWRYCTPHPEWRYAPDGRCALVCRQHRATRTEGVQGHRAHLGNEENVEGGSLRYAHAYGATR